jgi:hypothetical protein
MEATMVFLWTDDRPKEGFILLLIMGSLMLCHCV